ncbi:alcohol oxidase [Obba rivulosa]|uniref:Alcohol oxidase n=1 Tax=Obba rivulosa TaxID=1052685 RepID=A0A8E2DRW0_9APHY|nr:alcohol oxidase [Obba rivulosa]
MTASLTEVADKSFDYVICGEVTTAGLTLAARLSEDPDVTVLVLEAGLANLNDPELLRPCSYGVHFGQPGYTWPHMTTKQRHCMDLEYAWFRGKGLGGSSSINFMGWGKPPTQEIDDIERLGNPGWNWANYQRFLSRTEGFVPPTETVKEQFGLNVDDWKLSINGPLKVSFPGSMSKENMVLHETFLNAGIPLAKHPLDGDPNGAMFGPNNYDPITHTRSYAATAFLLPNMGRSNLTVLVEATVKRVMSDMAENGQYTATGVEFIYASGSHIANANREVIISSGALKSPQILELSGFGKREVLEKISIPVKADLPGVGENVQEHLLVLMNFEVKDDADFNTPDELRDPLLATRHRELHVSGLGWHTTGIVNYAFLPLKAISSRADDIIASFRDKLQKNGWNYPPGLLEQYRIQLERLETGAPELEIISYPGISGGTNPPEPGKRYVTCNAAINSCFSRGTIHATSDNTEEDPTFDPHYFEEEIDMEIVFEFVKFVRGLAHVTPLKDLVVGERNPGPDVQTDDELCEYIKTNLSTVWHTASSCSMLPREKRGVVDSHLKVYSTNNLRVVDLSILPLHVSAHTQATVYAIAEQAADIIKSNFQK